MMMQKHFAVIDAITAPSEHTNLNLLLLVIHALSQPRHLVARTRTRLRSGRGQFRLDQLKCILGRGYFGAGGFESGFECGNGGCML
jgi:hypothetical protein